MRKTEKKRKGENNSLKKKTGKGRRLYRAGGIVLIALFLWKSSGGAMELGGFDVEIGVGEGGVFEEESNAERQEEPPLPESEPIIEFDTVEETESPVYTVSPIQEEFPAPEEPSLAVDNFVPTEPAVLIVPPTPTALPVQSEAAVPTATPQPEWIPSEAPSMADAQISAVPVETHTDITKEDSYEEWTETPRIIKRRTAGKDPSVRLKGKENIQILSFRINGKECAWKWEEDALKAASETKDEERILELVAVCWEA